MSTNHMSHEPSKPKALVRIEGRKEKKFWRSLEEYAATDPRAPYVYLLTTRYGVLPPGCSSHCPSPFIAMTVSSDGGTSFGAQTPLCMCLGSKGQGKRRPS